MVKHIILWKLKEEFNKREVKSAIKENLEGLMGKIPGLLKMSVIIEGLDSSNADVMLDSEFLDESALKNYAAHPEHVAVADTFVRPYTQTRMCLDFNVD